MPHPVTSTEADISERERIALQIQAVVRPYRHELERNDPEVLAQFRERANMLLDSLDAAVKSHPDLLRALAVARAELAQDAR